MELISKDEAMRRFKPFGREIPKDIVIGVIASVKEEVVRCEECKRWSYSSLIDNRNRCERTLKLTKADDFCSYGERSEE